MDHLKSFVNSEKKEKKNKPYQIKSIRKGLMTKIFLLFLFLPSFINKISSKNNNYRTLNSNSYQIQLKVKGTGSKTICSASTIPDNVYIFDSNGEYLKESYPNTNQVNLYEEESKVVLQFNDIIDGQYLFAGLDFITEADLSSCSLKDMTSMFSGCTSLTSINLSGLDATSVQSAASLFCNCESLISVDFSQVDLTNIIYFDSIFTNCLSLEYINLINYDESIPLESSQIQLNQFIPSNLVICIDESKAPVLYNSLNSIKCPVVYCGENWKGEQLTYNVEEDKCEKIGELETDELNDDLPSEKEKENSYYSFQANKLTEFFNNDKDIPIEEIMEAIKMGEFRKFMEGTYKNELYKILDDKIYQVSTLSAQMKNDEIASIYLGNCEDELRADYNIDPFEELIIFKVGYIIQETKTQIIEYTIFTPDGVELYLDTCEYIPIYHEIPIFLKEEDLDKYNPYSQFYNDVCIQYTSEYKTDMTKYDRRNEFNERNMALCENNCEFINYNEVDKKVICNCKVKIGFQYLDGVDKGTLLQKLTNDKKLVNFEVIKCFEILFSEEGLITNIGSYITGGIIFINIINLIIFLSKGYKIFFKRIHALIQIRFNEILNTKNKNNDDKPPEIIMNQRKIFTANDKGEINKKAPPKKRTNKKSKTHKIEDIKSQISPPNDINDISFSDKNFENTVKVDNNNNNNNSNKSKDELNDFEMNSLSYEEAQKNDDRNYCSYYLSLLKTKQLIIFTFCVKTDYNSRLIKISSFFLTFAIFYTVKALFFNDAMMHVIYKNAGDYDFVYQIPQIIYSTIISMVISGIISNLSLTQINVINIKNFSNERGTDEYINEFNKFIKRIKIKFTIYFILNFLLLFLFWYYLSSFCAVYKNTQWYLIIDVSISFGISLIYPFFINLFPGIFRIISLKDKNGSHKCLFYFSKMLQLL